MFQRQCKVLFEHVLGDPGVQEYGSSGHKQDGIDLLARRKSSGPNHWIGIQCKLKIKSEKMQKRTVRDEAQRALAFKPELKELIIVTTASDDPKLQQEAAAITHEQGQLGRDFCVQVWGWETIVTHILQNEKVIQAFSPDAFPHIRDIARGQERLAEQVRIVRAEILSKLDLCIQRSPYAPDQSSVGETHSITCVTELDRQIDQYREICNSGHSTIARNFLRDMWDRLPTDAPRRIRFRVKANIAACQWRLGEQDEAGRLYLDAFDCAPDEPNAPAVKVLGMTLLGRYQEAYVFGTSMIGAVTEKNTLIAQTLVAARYLPAIKDAFRIIHGDIDEDALIAVAKVDYLRTHGSSESWHELATDAHARYPDDPRLARYAAEAVVDHGCLWSDRNGAVMLSVDQKRDVCTAIETLSEQFEQMLARQDAPTDFDEALCSNLATAYRLLRSYEEAKATLCKGLAIVPECTSLRQNLAMVALEGGDFDAAADLLDHLPDSRDKIFGQLQVFANKSAWRKVTSLSDSANITGYSLPDKAFFEAIVLLARIRLGECSDPRQSVNDLLQKYDTVPIVAIILYEVAAERDDRQWSAALYRTALERSNEISLPSRLMLARVAEREDDPDSVIDLLNGQVSITSDNDGLRMLARAFVNAQPRQDAVLFRTSLDDYINTNAFFARVVGSIDFNRGALCSAEIAFRAAISADRTDLVSHLGLINTLLRLDKPAEVEAHLHDLNLTFLSGSSVEKLTLSQLLVRFGRPQDGLDYAYQTMLRSRDDGPACLVYVGLFLPSTGDFKLSPISEVVTEGCTVEIERNDGKRLKVTIEAGPDRPDIDHYNPQHTFAGRLIGARPGDIVTNETRSGTPQHWRVVSINHKYLALLHDIMETFPARFPNVRGLSTFELQDGDIAPIVDLVKKTAHAEEDLFARYADGALPLCIIAALLGRSTLKVPSQIAARGKVIRTCIGNSIERDTALAAIANSRAKGLVLDAYTAWCAYSAGLLFALKTLFPRIVLPQSVIDEIRTWRRRFEYRGESPLMTLGYLDGQCIRQELSPEQLRQSAAEIDKGIKQLKNECEVLPSSAPVSPSELERLIGELSFARNLDPIYLAVSEDLLLLSEDLHYRNLAKQLYQREGIWLQSALIVALNDHVIDDSSYARYVVDLAARKHDYVTLNTQVLMEIAEQGDDNRMPQLQTVLDFIGTPNCDADSHSRVGLDFLVHTWGSSRLSDFRKERASGLMLSRLMPIWSRDSNVAHVLNDLINMFGRLPQLQTYLRGWARGHFILLDDL